MIERNYSKEGRDFILGRARWLSYQIFDFSRDIKLQDKNTYRDIRKKLFERSRKLPLKMKKTKFLFAEFFNHTITKGLSL
jgi:hypothetical protein